MSAANQPASGTAQTRMPAVWAGSSVCRSEACGRPAQQKRPSRRRGPRGTRRELDSQLPHPSTQTWWMQSRAAT
jgi:hypothetical protein